MAKSALGPDIGNGVKWSAVARLYFATRLAKAPWSMRSPAASTTTEASPASMAWTACCSMFPALAPPLVSCMSHVSFKPILHARSIAWSGSKVKLETAKPSTSLGESPASLSARLTASPRVPDVVVPGCGCRVYGDSPAPMMDTAMSGSLLFSWVEPPEGHRGLLEQWTGLAAGDS